MTPLTSADQPRRRPAAKWQWGGIAVLCTAVITHALPVIANALASGRVRANGSLDAASATNISRVSKPAAGTYCFQLAQPARVGVASASAVENRMITAQVFTPQDGAARLSVCPAGHPYAVMTFVPNGAKVDADFYVAFF